MNSIQFLYLFLLPLVSTNEIVHKITNDAGQITSPNFPNSYPTDKDVTWNFETKPGYKIVVYFIQFDIEDSYEEDKGPCVYDYVQIIEAGKELYRFCGSSANHDSNAPILEKQIHSKGNTLSLRLVSDYSNEEPFPKGFSAHYKIEDRDECEELKVKVRYAYEDWDEIIYCNHQCHNTLGSYYCSCDQGFHLHENRHTCTSDCQDIVLVDDFGKIKTSRFPEAYSKLADCTWTLKGKAGISIDIRFINQFEIERHFDEGCVYDWLEYKTAGGVVSDKYCGKSKPNNGDWIRTNSHEVEIMFHSDLTEEEAGFEMEYRFNRISCPATINSPVNGGMIAPTKGHYEFEDVITFVCNKGYRVLGDKSIMCTKDGTWSGKGASCIAIICEHPAHLDHVPHGEISTMPPNFAYGAIVSFTCVGEWYEVTSGALDWICGDDAIWRPHSELVAPNDNNNAPVCSPLCGKKGNKFILQAKSDQPSSWTNKEGFLVAAVVMGFKAKNGEWPWMAFIDLYSQGLAAGEFCGGALVSERTVITAAHCTAQTYKSSVRVYIGASDRLNSRDTALQTFGVSEMIQHENFSTGHFDNDIAVLILDRPVVIGKFARPVCLPRSDFEKSLPELALSGQSGAQKTGIIAGWGVTESGTASYDLNMARVPPIGHKDCIDMYEKNKPDSYEGINITENMICAGEPDGGRGRDSCSGDSGGPLMFKDNTRGKYFMIGIVSLGSTEACGKGTFGIYTRVSKYLSWIDNFLKN